jgi:hypothetical protein
MVQWRATTRTGEDAAEQEAVMQQRQTRSAFVIAASVFLVALAASAQDRSAIRVPDGIGFADVKGYEKWEAIAPSIVDDGVKVILGNPVMMKAYQDGVVQDGRSVPDGAMMAKIEWEKQTNAVSPYPVTVPGKLMSVSFMIKDAKRFAGSGGWGYAQFKYQPDADTFAPVGTGSACGFTCHTRVKARDYVFTSYARR